MAAAGTAASAVLVFATGGAAQALASALQRGGHRVAVATGEEEALQALEDAHYDLVVVHLLKADPERLDVIKLMRMGDPWSSGPPVIVLADAMNADVEQACVDARVDLRLASPVDPGHLLDYVADLLARSRSD